jgi:hypothetical protein
MQCIAWQRQRGNLGSDQKRVGGHEMASGGLVTIYSKPVAGPQLESGPVDKRAYPV